MMRWLKSLYNHDYSKIRAEEELKKEELNSNEQIIEQANVEGQKVCEEQDSTPPKVSPCSSIKNDGEKVLKTVIEKKRDSEIVFDEKQETSSQYKEEQELIQRSKDF